MNYATWTISLGLSAAAAGVVHAQDLTCKAAAAWRLEAEGLASNPMGSRGYADAGTLKIDTDRGTISSQTGPLPGMILVSTFDPATGTDLVFASPDGSLLFRARNLGGSIPYMLVDTYDLYVGQCHE